MVWILSGAVGDGWLWRIKGMGLRDYGRVGGPKASTWVVAEGPGLRGLRGGHSGIIQGLGRLLLKGRIIEGNGC